MSSEDINYYRRRAAVERANARCSTRSDIAEIHEELARLYDALIEHEPLRSTLSIVTPGSRSFYRGH